MEIINTHCDRVHRNPVSHGYRLITLHLQQCITEKGMLLGLGISTCTSNSQRKNDRSSVSDQFCNNHPLSSVFSLSNSDNKCPVYCFLMIRYVCIEPVSIRLCPAVGRGVHPRGGMKQKSSLSFQGGKNFFHNCLFILLSKRILSS